MNSSLCGTCCLYFFYLLERIHYHDDVSKMFLNKQLTLNVFGNSSFSHDKGQRTDTSFFVQKPYLRTIYI